MQYVTDLSKYQTENRTAVTLGKFDGLHRGHQELISRIQRFADQEKAESVVFAFDMGERSIDDRRGKESISGRMCGYADHLSVY